MKETVESWWMVLNRVTIKFFKNEIAQEIILD